MTEAPTVPAADVSVMLLREEREGTFRAICFDCVTSFDLFGTIGPVNALGDSLIIQRCLEHLGLCGERTPIAAYHCLKHREDAYYKLSVTWTK